MVSPEENVAKRVVDLPVIRTLERDGKLQPCQRHRITEEWG